ncbi:MAG: N-formylglutamate amidohydrolase [Clostridia bacterium]|nr:N-formylglutamate amidohydrolase [Clostridia bacterium]
MLEKIRAAARARLEEKGEVSFILRQGAGSVMFSAPHCVEQLRNGCIKYAEPQTGLLAEMLHEGLHCPIIRKQNNLNDDANYDAVCPYKDVLSDYVNRQGVRYLMDLHQLAPSREEIINIGTGEYENADEEVARAVEKCFLKAGIPVWIDQPFKASYPHTVSAAIHRRCGIQCVQIEINSRLLMEGQGEYCLEKVYRCLAECHRALTELNV